MRAGLRMKKAHVTHPELKCTFCLDILGVKKNPNGASYTQLGVVTKGTVIEASARACMAACTMHASDRPWRAVIPPYAALAHIKCGTLHGRCLCWPAWWRSACGQA